MSDYPSSIELFHLLFLRFLEQRLPKQNYALKGGCNLRFFFRSIRYSEDIDLDAWTIEPHALLARVNNVLKSTAFNEVLTVQRIKMLDLRQHKQTDTTQRWKMSIQSLAGGPQHPTKIEFLRRSKCPPNGVPIEMVDTEIVNQYRLTQPLSRIIRLRWLSHRSYAHC